MEKILPKIQTKKVVVTLKKTLTTNPAWSFREAERSRNLVFLNGSRVLLLGGAAL